MTKFGGVSNGEFILNSGFQTANWVTTPHSYPEPDEWEAHFWQCATIKGWNLARPTMYGGKPYWRGDLHPPGIMDRNPEIYEYIADFDLKYKLVETKHLRHPTNDEYTKYFKTYVAKGLYQLHENNKQRNTLVKKCPKTPLKSQKKA